MSERYLSDDVNMDRYVTETPEIITCKWTFCMGEVVSHFIVAAKIQLPHEASSNDSNLQSTKDCANCTEQVDVH